VAVYVLELTVHDRGGAVAEKYGVLHAAGVAERALIGIDREGTVRHIDITPFQEIPDTGACMTALGG
jgi:alkyl hydroperoxide reductase subunit AhpC